jgi:hypothetical protein
MGGRNDSGTKRSISCINIALLAISSALGGKSAQPATWKSNVFLRNPANRHDRGKTCAPTQVKLLQHFDLCRLSAKARRPSVKSSLCTNQAATRKRFCSSGADTNAINPSPIAQSQRERRVSFGNIFPKELARRQLPSLIRLLRRSRSVIWLLCSIVSRSTPTP